MIEKKILNAKVLRKLLFNSLTVRVFKLQFAIICLICIKKGLVIYLINVCSGLYPEMVYFIKDPFGEIAG